MTDSRLVERVSGSRHAALGTRRIWLGAVIILCIQILFDFGTTLTVLPALEDPVPLITAWIVLIVADVAAVVVTRVLGEYLPAWMYWLWVTALATVLALDLLATHHRPDPGSAISVGVSATLSLLLAVVTRPSYQILPVALVFTGGTACVWVLSTAYQPEVAYNAVFTLCQMLLPIIVAVIIADEFRRLMRREMEEVLSHSAVAAPRLTVGIEASEQLARLDLAAESLLGAVADGRMRLPLSEEVAKRAGVLASELRLHLLASRSKTWLALAIDESTLLSHDVRIVDASASAGLLGTRQRAALLSALWLLHDGRLESGRAGSDPISLTFGEPAPSMESTALAAVSVRIEVPGSTRMRIEPGVWQYFAQVGRYRETLDGSGIRVDVVCLVPSVRGGARGRTVN
jgi:hypothetical protein